MPNAIRVLVTIAVLVTTTVGLGLALPAPAEGQLPISKEHKFTGTGSCAASNCHGATKPAQKPGDPDAS